jgi:hypothetical protein
LSFVDSRFLLSKAVAELLLVVICAPLEMFEIYTPSYDQGGAYCRLGYFVEVISAAASVFNLVAVSAERYANNNMI